jgi:SAM-dependent methyltransferase
MTHATVAELLTAFTDATPDRIDAQFQRLAGALWRDGTLTELARPAAATLVASLDRIGEDRQGHLLVLLGLLAEAEHPVEGPVAAEVRRGLPRYLDLVKNRDSGEPLTLALLYLLSQFPDDRDQILAAVADLDLDAEDRTRLERSLQRLNPADPDLGRVWPSPSAWPLDEAERAYHQAQTRTLTPAQVAANWENDTRTVLAYSGAKAYWAARHGAPAVVTDAVPAHRPVQPGPAPEGDILARHATAFRCRRCGGRLSFGADGVRCASCGTAYPIANGVLDLTTGITEGTADEVTADLLSKLAAMPTLGIYYESVLRPAFLRIAGANWDNAVTPADEDRYLAEHLRPVDGPVLDVAAGAGRWTEVVAKTVGADRVIALDMALPMLNVLRARLPQVPAVLASATALPFDDASLGAVNCWNALQAFPDDAAAGIAEMGRCLRPGGSFTMMTFRWDDDPIARYFQASHYFPSRVEGMLLFTVDEIRQWLTDAGMTVRDISGHGTFVFVTAEKTKA